jgi:hypothetical protein
VIVHNSATLSIWLPEQRAKTALSKAVPAQRHVSQISARQSKTLEKESSRFVRLTVVREVFAMEQMLVQRRDLQEHHLQLFHRQLVRIKVHFMLEQQLNFSLSDWLLANINNNPNNTDNYGKLYAICY